jgi:hypothetical protein
MIMTATSLDEALDSLTPSVSQAILRRSIARRKEDHEGLTPQARRSMGTTG